MKKFAFVLLFVWLFSAVLSISGFAEDPSPSGEETDAPADEITPFFALEKGTDTEIVIDGVKESAYDASPVVEINRTKSTRSQTTGKAWLLWNADYLYVYTEIKDSNQISAEAAELFYNTDSVELMLNLQYPFQGTTDSLNAGQYTASPCENAENKWQGVGKHYDANKDNAVYAHRVDPETNTYSIEMKIPFGEEFTPEKGRLIGFCMHINDEQCKDVDGVLTQTKKRFANIFTGDPETQTNAYQLTQFMDLLALTDSSLHYDVIELPPVSVDEEESSAESEEATERSTTPANTEAPTTPVSTPPEATDAETAGQSAGNGRGCQSSVQVSAWVGIGIAFVATAVHIRRRKER